MKLLFRCTLSLALWAAVPAELQAQAYPSKPIRIINPFAAGGPIDLIARLLGQKMQESLGQPVIVESKPGAGGAVGLEFAAKSPPDGYTLAVLPNGNAVVLPHIDPKLAYDPFRDFAPVALLATVQNVLVASPKLQAATIPELIARAKADPGKLNYATPGLGSTAHVAAELFKLRAGVDMVHVPYKGTAPAITDLLGGQVDLMFAQASSVVQHVRDGKLKALGVASLARPPTLPELPTIAEQGVDGFEAVSWYALVAPAATPADIVARLSAEVARIMREPDVRERLIPLGADPAPSSPDELRARMRDESAVWAEVVRKAGIRPD